MTDIGNRIHNERKRLGLTLKQLAELVGDISYQALQQIESGESRSTKHTVRIAAALGLRPQWLATGRGEPREKKRIVRLLGYVGAGAEVRPFDDSNIVGLQEIEAPDIVDAGDECLQIRGTSMYPLQDGWKLFYRPGVRGVLDECLNKLCVAQVKDGPLYVKVLRRGSKSKTFTLESWNEPPREDMMLEWAAPVRAIITI